MNYDKEMNEMFVQITSGRGPAECCWVVAKVLKDILIDLKEKGITYSVISRTEGPIHHTISSVLIKVEGDQVKEKLKEWEGTIQWVGQSPYRKYHRRKNWFIGVSFFEDKSSQKINHKDIKIQTFRSSGPGGQHRNKVETAVRATHQALGISVVVTDGKSQYQNKQKALEKLKEKFALQRVENTKKSIEEQWVNHLSLERGNAVKVFRGSSFK